MQAEEETKIGSASDGHRPYFAESERTKLRWWYIGASETVFITAPETSMSPPPLNGHLSDDDIFLSLMIRGSCGLPVLSIEEFLEP